MEKEVGRFEVFNLPINLNDKIGEGSCANIYKYTLREKPAAVKYFKSNIPKENILTLASNMRQLNHKNVIRFRGYSVRPSSIFLEYCSLVVGDKIIYDMFNLTSELNNINRYVFKERMDYIYQALCGLDYLHTKNIIHKDFKPKNLLVQGTNLNDITVKVTDFDDLLMVKQTIKSTITSNLKGLTLSYTAPELCEFTVKKPTKESDIYAFSITAYEILNINNLAWSETLPILHDGLLYAAIVQGKRPSMEGMQQTYACSKDLHSICKTIEKCWRKDFVNRPGTKEVLKTMFCYY